MTNDTHKLFCTRKINLKAKFGSGDYVEAELVGDLREYAKQKMGKKHLLLQPK